MGSTRMLWGAVSIAALAATIMLVFGLVYAVNDMINPKPSNLATEPGATPDKNDWAHKDGRINIVALGDSLTKGTGDRTGAGYIGRLKDKLAEASGLEVRIVNKLAIDGYRTDQLLHDLTDKPTVAETVSKADMIVFTIGGNDLFKFVREELDITSAEVITAEDLLRSIPEPSERLNQILKRLHEINPEATIVYVGLYNPFLDLDPSRKTSLAIAEWNAKAYAYINELPNAIMVPTADLFERQLLKYLYSDHFHPNDEGYDRMADRIAKALY